MLKARIGVQYTGRTYLTVWEDGREILRKKFDTRVEAEKSFNALQESRLPEMIELEIETNL